MVSTTSGASSARRLDPVAELERLRRIASELGGTTRVERQHARGFLTARERLDLLLDPGSSIELGRLVHSGIAGEEERTLGDGRLVGFGAIDGRPVAYVASDATIKGASGGAGSSRRGAVFERIVATAALPTFGLLQGGGARITDVLSSKFTGFFGAALGRRLAFPRRGAHFVAVLGNYYAPWSVADADLAIMTRASNASISSPPVVEEATGKKTTPFELGGADVHAGVTGQIDAVVDDDAAACAYLRRAFGYLRSSPWDEEPVVRTGDPPDRFEPELRAIVPEDPAWGFDVKRVLERVVDSGSFLEWKPDYGRNLVCGLARLDGHTIAVIANQPRHLAGSMDVAASIKIRRMLDACSAFGLPLVSFLDVPGVLPTPDQEHQRLLAHIYGLAVDRLRAHVPKVSVFLRKAYGYALWGMSGADPEWYSFAWPSAQIAFMGPEPGVRVAWRREWEAAADPASFLVEHAAELRRAAQPWAAAERAYIDDIIDPAATRPVLVRALAIARARSRAPHRRS
jgi:acetyl-CoA carboxylase carboxyltransferase component